MKRLSVVVPLGTLIGVLIVLGSIFAFFKLQGLLYPDNQAPTAASQHRAISRAISGLERQNEQEFLSAQEWGDPLVARRAWKVCSAAFNLNPRISGNNDNVPWQIEIAVTVPGDESKGCVLELDWTGSDWLHHRGWSYETPSSGSS